MAFTVGVNLRQPHVFADFFLNADSVRQKVVRNMCGEKPPLDFFALFQFSK